MEKAYVDFHVIQTLPPSCVNRDDTGSPKTAIYGGVRRARVSSQAWKRAMRTMFREHLDEASLGVRTKRIVDLIIDQIKIIDPDVSETGLNDRVRETINVASVDAKKPILPAPKELGAGKKETQRDQDEGDALFFIGLSEARRIAQIALAAHVNNQKPEKKAVQEALNQDKTNQSHAIDVALFGRMVAKAPDLCADASAQVAHCISTHKVENEYDYFTAMDERSPENNSGAGMLGTIEYSSATLYRYATVAAHELLTQLASDGAALEKAINEFARAFITSMPTGKQNTFANRTLPDAVMVTVRCDLPVNFAGAFEEPVKGEGYARQSVQRLSAYATQVYDDFCGKPFKTYLVGNVPGELGERVSLPALVEGLGKDVRSMLRNGQELR